MSLTAQISGLDALMSSHGCLRSYGCFRRSQKAVFDAQCFRIERDCRREGKSYHSRFCPSLKWKRVISCGSLASNDGMRRHAFSSTTKYHSRVLKIKGVAYDTVEEGNGNNNLPLTPVQMVEQAARCVEAALEAGNVRQQVDLLLPVNEKERRFTATEPEDYPCSLQREFECACSLTSSILQRVIGSNDVEITVKRIDDGGVEGEPCAVLYPAESKSIVAVVYPTAERMKQIQSLASDSERPLLIINPQWRDEGNIVSDFGFFWQRNAVIEFLAQFVPSYYLKEKRIGSPGTISAATGSRFASGGVVRVLRQWPGQYECYALAADGSSQLLQSVEIEPQYKDLDEMISLGRQQKLEIFNIAVKATDIYAESGSMGGINDEDAAESEETDNIKELEYLSDADIDVLDSASLRRILISRGQPASGKISKLRERVKDLYAR